MKKALCLMLIASLIASCLFAQGSKEDKAANSEKKEIIVFAAASMTETMNKLKASYESTHSNISIVYNFDSSGTLKTQIEQGADCDLFISAAKKQMNALKDLNMLDNATIVDFLENKTALAVPAGNPKNITSFDQLASLLKEGKVFLAIGNSDVPVGQYTEKIFKYYGIDMDETAKKGCITYGTNVKEVTTQVASSSVDCGIIYATDAYSAGLTVVDTATADMTGGRVIYPAAILKNAKNRAEAEEFFAYLKTVDAMKVFESVGFASAL